MPVKVRDYTILEEENAGHLLDVFFEEADAVFKDCASQPPDPDRRPEELPKANACQCEDGVAVERAVGGC